MNKLQQEILEIIKPYTDKTLSDGCIIGRGKRLFRYLYRLPDKDFHRFMTHEYNWDIKLARFQKWKLSIEAVFGAWIEEEILWHYDIIAVEKYIHNNWWIGLKFIKGNIDYKEVWINGKTFIFPNKPLHLYNEQENKDLLELLNKLCTIFLK